MVEFIFEFQNHNLIKLQLENPRLFSFILFSILSLLLLFPYRKIESADFLHKPFTDSLRGFAILVIIIGHFNYRVIENQPLILWGWLGAHGVPIFLILSGYAISESYKKKGLLHFFEKRFMRVYIPFFISNAFFLVLDFFLLGKRYNFLSFLQFLSGYKTTIGTYWFLHFLFYFYFLFFIAFSLIKTNTGRLFFLFIGSTVPFIFDSFGRIAQETAFSFPIGVLLSSRKEILDRIKSTFSLKLIIFLCSLLILNYFFQSGTSPDVLGKNLQKSFWSLFIISMLYAIIHARTPRVFCFLGRISYELYLLHLPFLYSYDFILYKLPLYFSFPIYMLFIITTALLFQLTIKKIGSPDSFLLRKLRIS